MFRFLSLFCIVFVIVLVANEQDVQTVEKSIKKYYKNQKIKFLHIHKMKDENYFLIIKSKNMQERITVDKKGKILSIIDDLSMMDGVEEGC